MKTATKPRYRVHQPPAGPALLQRRTGRLLLPWKTLAIGPAPLMRDVCDRMLADADGAPASAGL